MPAHARKKEEQQDQALVAPLREFLGCATPAAWIDWALDNPALLLIDHANCEKKAASTALNLIFRYTDFPELLHKLSRLAREELRHFEQVLKIMQQRGISYETIGAARYASGLRAGVRSSEPGRLVDTLVVGAIIEARSCERFAALAPHLDAELAAFYRSLLKSESRHFRDYLKLAEQASDAAEVARRVEVFLALEAPLIQGEDQEFRFHSGIPAEVIAVSA